MRMSLLPLRVLRELVFADLSRNNRATACSRRDYLCRYLHGTMHGFDWVAPWANRETKESHDH